MVRRVLGVVVLGAALGLVVWALRGEEAEPQPPLTSVALVPEGAELQGQPQAKGGALSGRVVRAGQPAPGARVSLKGGALRTETSGPDGAFTFLDPPEGPLYLSAADADSASEVTGPLEVRAGQSVSGVVLVLAPAVQVEGVVVELLGRKPVPQAWVSSSAGVRATDPSGRFSLRGARGPTWLEVGAPGYLSRSEWVSLELARAGGRLEVVLTPASRLEGTVLEASAPAPGATVWVEQLEGGARGERSATAFTGKDGAFSVEGPAGLVRLWAVTPRGTRVTGPVLRLAVGEVRTGLVLDGGDPTTALGVVTRDGRPVAGARLLALAASTEAVVGTATSAPDGQFAFASLVPGRYLVQVQQGALSALFGPLEHRPDGQPWQVTLAGGRALQGRVEPVAAGVRVRWRSGGWVGPPAETVTDARGQFRFEGLPDELVSLDAEGPGGAATARARPGDEVVLALHGGEVVVHLQDDSGAPITDGVLLARSLDTGASRRQLVLAPDGMTRLELPYGPWELTLEAPGQGRSAAARLSVGAAPLDVRLSLEASVTVQGVVRDAESQLPLSGVEIVAVSGADTSPFRVAVQTDRRGAFVLPPTPRSARLLTHHPAYLPQARGAAEGGRWDVALARAPHDVSSLPATQFEGVGMVLDGRSGVVRVAQVNEGGPAERAGVAVGDAVVAVDGTPTAGVPLEQTVGRIRGPAGTPVVLEVERAGQRFELTVRRRLLTL
jgi:PDZ domain/Carboxypeptidase regulatory-like domain